MSVATSMSDDMLSSAIDDWVLDIVTVCRRQSVGVSIDQRSAVNTHPIHWTRMMVDMQLLSTGVNNLSHCPLDAVGEAFVGELTLGIGYSPIPSSQLSPTHCSPFASRSCW